VVLSPLHDRLKAAGACFGVAGAYERPMFFGQPGATPQIDLSFGKQSFYPHVADECASTRSGQWQAHFCSPNPAGSGKSTTHRRAAILPSDMVVMATQQRNRSSRLR
jgi:hypothetical protein